MFREPAKFWVNKGTLCWDRIPIFGIQVITESLTLGFGSLGNPNWFFNFEIFCESFNKTLHYRWPNFKIFFPYYTIFQQNLIKILQNQANLWQIPDLNLKKKIPINPKSLKKWDLIWIHGSQIRFCLNTTSDVVMKDLFCVHHNHIMLWAESGAETIG